MNHNELVQNEIEITRCRLDLKFKDVVEQYKKPVYLSSDMDSINRVWNYLSKFKNFNFRIEVSNTNTNKKHELYAVPSLELHTNRVNNTSNQPGYPGQASLDFISKYEKEFPSCFVSFDYMQAYASGVGAVETKQSELEARVSKLTETIRSIEHSVPPQWFRLG